MKKYIILLVISLCLSNILVYAVDVNKGRTLSNMPEGGGSTGGVTRNDKDGNGNGGGSTGGFAYAPSTIEIEAQKTIIENIIAKLNENPKLKKDFLNSLPKNLKAVVKNKEKNTAQACAVCEENKNAKAADLIQNNQLQPVLNALDPSKDYKRNQEFIKKWEEFNNSKTE
jgi:uncharacterized spore protein YtfJ